MKRQIHKFLFLTVCLVSLIPKLKAEVVLTATVNKATVAVGEQFQLTFSLNTIGNNFKGPDLRDFKILAGPSQNTSMSFINGSMSQSISFTYYLQALTEGTFKIGFASIEADGRRIQSNGLILTVVKGNPAQKQNQAQQPEGVSDKNIFLRAEVNKNTVYQGEALTVTFKLFTNLPIGDPAISKAPSLNGFWNHDIELPDHLPWEDVVVNGIGYKAYVTKKVVLFPQQTGTLTIDPMEMQCIARIQGKKRYDPFSDPFFGFGNYRDIKVSFSSNKVVINVKELPKGAPAGFNGSVGQLSFNATLDKTTTKANEPVTLKIKISGTGNLKLIELPPFEFPGDIETYEPKISDNLRAGESGISGSKTLEYLLIPRHEGVYDLPPVTFSYFDLGKKQYISKTEGPFHLRVTRGTGPSSSAVSPSVSKSDFQLLGKDIRYIKINEPEFIATTGRFFGSPLYYTFMVSPFLMLGGLALYRQRQTAINSDVVLLKSRNATTIAQKRLSAAQKFLAAGQHASFFEEVSKAMWGFMSDKLSIPPAELSKEKVQQKLAVRNVNPEYIQSFIQTLDECEMARFAGATAGNAEETYRRALNSISSVEQSLKG